ncbi:MAG: ATP synthase delta/epsilon chain alpha-helix domain-containing protein, partial [Anaerolineales bacterium]|nr:ATP synthase delta/epsilon chain alpha-helix domain-containing protein [Anaerolineales bacterium]
AVNTGYAEVTASRVTVLVETAERADLIDPERAKRALERAEEKIRKLPKQDMEFETARLALLRAVTRINVAGKN